MLSFFLEDVDNQWELKSPDKEVNLRKHSGHHLKKRWILVQVVLVQVLSHASWRGASRPPAARSPLLDPPGQTGVTLAMVLVETMATRVLLST